ncbi:MAG TPA: xanthine dehydrogenase accessory protein XdhC [Geminicoccus sp.]|uniref:xanthine dehydrogenase accessory protein XdhC n=1 Tax=Geminicoccus sp. TaxID=2024832 RepID=UPI002C16AA49|nr:xanthine dehydrogenase accessory protein XdhC [Geminicoccus sp.]HWL69642.1 xanthine dehydrogenase accessory protein XdhC [Geminicoccus sp.]
MTRAIRVTVVRAVGSTPRAAGAVMQVTRERIEGTIGGGQLEWQALKAARDMLDEGTITAEQEFTLGPSLRQCCGGRVLLRFEATDQPFAEPLPTHAQQLVLLGAGHIGQALLRVLAPLPWQITVFDPRPDWLPEPGPHLVVRHDPEPGPTVAAAPPGACYVVATHSHDLDLDVVDLVLRRGDARWLGLIGSMTKRRKFERRLIARGHPSSALGRLICPMGLPTIRDKHPAAIAISVAAELLSLPEEPSA